VRSEAYGPDADALSEVMEPLLGTAPVKEGSYAVEHYGEARDADALQVRVELAPSGSS